MTDAERTLLRSFARRTAGLTPLMGAALLKAYQSIRDGYSESDLQRIVALGFADRFVANAFSQALLDVAFQPMREQVRRSIAQSFRYSASTVPVPPSRAMGISFDVLNPKVIDAVRHLETRVITTLQGEVRETVRAFAENALRDGIGPRTWAKQVRSVIGLAPNQLQEVENYRDALRGLNGRTLSSYSLRDQRYDKLVKTGTITPTQVETAVGRYRKSRIALNAATNARTATVDALKLGQRLSWEDAADKGIVDRARLRRTWVGVMDTRERPEHRAMEGDTVAFDEKHSNGDMVPGSGDFNCRCLDRYFVASAG